MIEDKFYWYGIAAAVYIVTCWVFSIVRAVHNCGTPKERRAYIWPDRKMQVAVYASATVLLPYVLNPKSEAAWILFKSYFPGAYYYGEAMEDVEDDQPGCSPCHLPGHVPARASCLVAVRSADA